MIKDKFKQREQYASPDIQSICKISKKEVKSQLLRDLERRLEPRGTSGFRLGTVKKDNTF